MKRVFGFDRSWNLSVEISNSETATRRYIEVIDKSLINCVLFLTFAMLEKH